MRFLALARAGPPDSCSPALRQRILGHAVAELRTAPAADPVAVELRVAGRARTR
ncbi:hypothetical protein IU450_24595 [Nocardia abscessus]|uniref:hypothetical protein n=1 Tax=Nocardia abscessus TaxID=120957 RepID=UPI001895C352|nr:hypothetical protein [Nocardia abscessus]MBF6339050.1 hypothetical protein [Nocardia abscessus]